MFPPRLVPDDLVAAVAPWRTAFTATCEALDRGESVLLSAEPRSGTSAFLEYVAKAREPRGRPVQLMPGSGYEIVSSKGGLLSKDGLLVIDDPTRLTIGALRGLCASDRQFVAAGLPILANQVAHLAAGPTLVPLPLLSTEDVARFVSGRLSAVGAPRDLFTPDAVLQIGQRSGGRPWIVNALGHAALLSAEREGAASVHPRHVDEAWGMSDGLRPTLSSFPRSLATGRIGGEERLWQGSAPDLPGRRRLVMLLGGGFAGLIVGGGLLVFWKGSSTRNLVVAPTSAPKSSDPSIGEPGSQARIERHERKQIATGEGASLDARSGQPDGKLQPRPELGQAVGRPPALDGPVAFVGTVYNETLRQGGRMSLAITPDEVPGTVRARLEAWAGLLGSGELIGQLTPDGRIVASGQVMVGKNLFRCELFGNLSGSRLTGSATFVNIANGHVARSRFNLGKT